MSQHERKLLAEISLRQPSPQFRQTKKYGPRSYIFSVRRVLSQAGMAAGHLLPADIGIDSAGLPTVHLLAAPVRLKPPALASRRRNRTPGLGGAIPAEPLNEYLPLGNSLELPCGRLASSGL